jgi:hypothetical protein
MEPDDRRSELLERAYRRGYALRIRRRRRVAGLVSAVVVVGVAAGAIGYSAGLPDQSVSVRETPTSVPLSTCRPSISTVPSARVPSDVSAWANGAAVVGNGALWTLRTAIDAPESRDQGSWLLKFPWFTRPFGLPDVTARRLDGPGTFSAQVDQAIDSRGAWVVSGLSFSEPGCWEVSGHYNHSTLRFRVHIPTAKSTSPATSTAPTSVRTTTSVPDPTSTRPATPTSSTESPAPGSPQVTIGRWTGRQPFIIYFSGDAGNITTDLKWSSWNADRAVAHGTWHYLNCQPDCASGTSTPYPVTITLTDPVAGRFKRLVEETTGPHAFTMTSSAPNLGQGACTNSDNNTCAFAS